MAERKQSKVKILKSLEWVKKDMSVENTDPTEQSLLPTILSTLDKIEKRVDKAIKESNLPDEIKDSLNVFKEYGFIAIVLFLIIGSSFGWITLSPVDPFVVLDITNLGILGTSLMSVLLWGQLKKKANLIIAGKESLNRELELENEVLKNALEKSVSRSEQ